MPDMSWYDRVSVVKLSCITTFHLYNTGPDRISRCVFGPSTNPVSGINLFLQSAGYVTTWPDSLYSRAFNFHSYDTGHDRISCCVWDRIRYWGGWKFLIFDRTLPSHIAEYYWYDRTFGRFDLISDGLLYSHNVGISTDVPSRAWYPIFLCT